MPCVASQHSKRMPMSMIAGSESDAVKDLKRQVQSEESESGNVSSSSEVSVEPLTPEPQTITPESKSTSLKSLLNPESETDQYSSWGRKENNAYRSIHHGCNQLERRPSHIRLNRLHRKGYGNLLTHHPRRGQHMPPPSGADRSAFQQSKPEACNWPLSDRSPDSLRAT